MKLTTGYLLKSISLTDYRYLLTGLPLENFSFYNIIGYINELLIIKANAFMHTVVAGRMDGFRNGC